MGIPLHIRDMYDELIAFPATCTLGVAVSRYSNTKLYVLSISEPQAAGRVATSHLGQPPARGHGHASATRLRLSKMRLIGTLSPKLVPRRVSTNLT